MGDGGIPLRALRVDYHVSMVSSAHPPVVIGPARHGSTDTLQGFTADISSNVVMALRTDVLLMDGERGSSDAACPAPSEEMMNL